MDEDQFRAIYREINTQRCVFEKAINNRRCRCRHQHCFLLATREGVACQSAEALDNCTLFLTTLRESSRFALKETVIDGPLPHNKELKVQAGGCRALQSVLFPERDGQETVDDIDELVNTGLGRYGAVATFPYGDLVRGILNYESRRKPARR